MVLMFFRLLMKNDVTVESFLERNKELKSGRLTILTSDTLLKTYFPHRLIPHNIWIDTEGTVKYITGGEEMSKENILSFINGKQLNIKNKEDNRRFNPFEPFHLSDSEFVYRSILTKRIDGIPSGNAIYPVGHADKQKIIRVFSFNSILNNILWTAVNKGRSLGNYYNTMRIETTDSLRFFTPNQAPQTFEKSNYTSRNEWRAEHTHCYELRFPEPINDTLFYSYMLDDLKRNFNIAVEVVEDSIMCSIITVGEKPIAEPNENDSTFLRLSKDGLVAENVSVLYLFEYLNEKVKKELNDIPVDPPFIDKTGGMRISVKLDFEQGMPSYERIKELIQEKYGIRVIHQMDKYKITIVKDMS